MTVIAIDANFRLRRRVVSNEERDPALSSGWGYFVQDSQYRDFLRQQVDDDEVGYYVHGLGRVDYSRRLDQYLYRVRSTYVGQQQVHEGICNIRCRHGD